MEKAPWLQCKGGNVGYMGQAPGHGYCFCPRDSARRQGGPQADADSDRGTGGAAPGVQVGVKALRSWLTRRSCGPRSGAPGTVALTLALGGQDMTKSDRCL